MGPEDFRLRTDVSRETLERLVIFAELLERWNRRINLVSKSTLGELWLRHLLDSAQLLPLLPEAKDRVLADFGSGAGFPALVLAVMGAGEVHLIEADKRKAAFLREAIRVTEARAQVHEARIEQVPAFPVDVITARACAPLGQLLDWASRFPPRNAGICCLFPKGENIDQELTAIDKQETLRITQHPSCTNSKSSIIRINLDVEDADEAIPR